MRAAYEISPACGGRTANQNCRRNSLVVVTRDVICLSRSGGKETFFVDFACALECKLERMDDMAWAVAVSSGLNYKTFRDQIKLGPERQQRSYLSEVRLPLAKVFLDTLYGSLRLLDPDTSSICEQWYELHKSSPQA